MRRVPCRHKVLNRWWQQPRLIHTPWAKALRHKNSESIRSRFVERFSRYRDTLLAQLIQGHGRDSVAVVGATSVIRVARKETSSKLWAAKLLERKPARVVSVALANKTARIVWAMLARGEDYAVQASAMAA